MQMATTNSTVLKLVNVLSWVIFIGLCIKAGAILISFLVSLLINSDGAKNLYLGLNLYDVYAYDKRHYIQMVSLVLALTGLKAYIAYLVVKIFMKFNLSVPFNQSVGSLIFQISYFALATGIMAMMANAYSKWLRKGGVAVPLEWGSGEILFFAGVIYLIAEVFKKGTELQTENDLTV